VANINQSLVVTKQVIKYPGVYQELTVGDESIRLADWQINVESRLKRIEESLSLSNQDLILELIDIQQSIQMTPRYRWIKEANIAGDTLIWGSTPFGVWNTGKWGATANISFVLGNTSAAILGTSKLGSQVSAQVNRFIQQYQNDYEETFIDDDFEDTDGTGTWLTGTMLTTEYLQSSSVDYNNSTITKATATFTGSGAGTPTFYLSADGTNFEEVTSGTSHTFVNSGTDLRWKVLSTGGTYTLTKVEVNSYH